MLSRLELGALVEAVADGRDPDFSSLDGPSLDDDLRARLESLRAIFQIGQCFSTLTGSALWASVDAADSEDSATGSARPVPGTWRALHLRERVGRGRFGDVYRAWDPATDRDVALKLLRHRSHSTDTQVVHEARLMARVRHPNVVTIYGAAHSDGHTGLWMEFIEGETLENELRRSGSLRAEEVGHIGVELCRALSAVHDAGLVHRDVKAQNVMREVSGRLVLGDFGTGREVDLETVDTALAGTPVYLAPEIFEGQPATAQSDLYSLGVLLFHLATGSYPVLGQSIRELREAHRLRSSSRTRPALSVAPALMAVIDRALSSDPGDRFGSAEAMANALERLSTEADQASTSMVALKPQRRRLWLVAAMFVPVAIATGGFFRSAGERTWPVASLMPALGVSSVAPASDVPARRLRRVPAPMEAMFWGQPSSDGRTHTFIDMNGNVAVFDTVTGDIRRLSDNGHDAGAATENATFSPDNSQIAFGWETTRKTRQVRTVSVQGGNARIVWEGSEWPVVFDWSPSGDTLLCVLQRDDGPRRLVTLSLATGAVREVAALDVGFSTAAFSPSGRRVVFDRLQTSDAVERDVFIANVDNPGELRSLVNEATDDFGPLWIPEEGRVIFVSDRTAEPSIWGVAVDDDGNATDAATILHRNIGRVRPNGVAGAGSLFYTLQVGLVDVFRATLDETRQPALADITPVAPSQVGSKMNSDWSPGGDALVYVALPHAGAGGDRARRLSILDPRSNQIRSLNPPLNYYSFPRWSPDGQWILVKGTDLTSRSGVFLVDVRSGAIQLIAMVGGTTPHSIGPVRWGPDGMTIFFTRRGLGLMTLDLRTRVETRVLNPAAEGITEFTNNPGFALSPDGEAIAYSAFRKSASGTNETVLRVRPRHGPTRDLVTGPVVLQEWTRDGQILFTRSEGRSQLTRLWAVPAAGGEPRVLSSALVGLRDVQVHTDGRQLTFTTGFPGSELWALDSFLPPPPAPNLSIRR
jgi:Tol biopolymer transport system component